MTTNAQHTPTHQGQDCCIPTNMQHQGYTHTGFEAGAL